jgi:hypothetical protein
MNNPNLIGQLNVPIVVGSGDWLGGLLCKIGIHRWKTFEMADSFKRAFPEMSNLGRSCCCGALEYKSDNGTQWQKGCRGMLMST